MGQTILTSRQSDFLELAKGDPEIVNWFYFTGGTALSEFYMHHRYSEDIDLFTESDINDAEIDKLIQKAVRKLRAKNIRKRKISGLFIYELQFDDGSLKIDFANYPYKPVETGILYGKLKVDSSYDICINKVYTILSRTQVRDYIDLYFALKRNEFSLEQLLSRMEEKFGTVRDETYLGNQLLKVIDLPRDYPRMLVPFSFDEMARFYQDLSRKLLSKRIR